MRIGRRRRAFDRQQIHHADGRDRSTEEQKLDARSRCSRKTSWTARAASFFAAPNAVELPIGRSKRWAYDPRAPSTATRTRPSASTALDLFRKGKAPLLGGHGRRRARSGHPGVAFVLVSISRCRLRITFTGSGARRAARARRATRTASSPRRTPAPRRAGADPGGCRAGRSREACDMAENQRRRKGGGGRGAVDAAGAGAVGSVAGVEDAGVEDAGAAGEGSGPSGDDVQERSPSSLFIFISSSSGSRVIIWAHCSSLSASRALSKCLPLEWTGLSPLKFLGKFLVPSYERNRRDLSSRLLRVCQLNQINVVSRPPYTYSLRSSITFVSFMQRDVPGEQKGSQVLMSVFVGVGNEAARPGGHPGSHRILAHANNLGRRPSFSPMASGRRARLPFSGGISLAPPRYPVAAPP